LFDKITDAGRHFGVNAANLSVHGHWLMQGTNQPGPTERLYRDSLLYVYSERDGYTFTDEAEIGESRLPVGCSLEEFSHFSKSTYAAALDVVAACSVRLPRPSNSHSHSNSLLDRGVRRGEFIARQLANMHHDVAQTGTLALIGVSSSVARFLLRYFKDVRLYDSNAEFAAASDFQVLHSLQPCQELECVDICLTTGMTLSNGHFFPILERCRLRKTPLYVYANSAPSFFSFAQEIGLAGSFVERFPFFPSSDCREMHFFRGDK